MANIKEKFKDNVDGPFFVDQECIACDTCVGLAPKQFKLTVDCDHAYVSVQPKNQEEITACHKAMVACPVEAIGQIG